MHLILRLHVKTWQPLMLVFDLIYHLVLQRLEENFLVFSIKLIAAFQYNLFLQIL